MKPTINVANANGIGAYLHHARTEITGQSGTYPGDDCIIISIPNYRQYGTDLCQQGDIALSFSKSQAQRLARQLNRMAQELMTAEERAEMNDKPIVTVPAELLKHIGL